MNPVILFCNLSDITYEQQRQLLELANPRGLFKRWAAHFRLSEWRWITTASMNNKIIGWSCISLGECDGAILGVFVEEKYRGFGIAKKLLNILLDVFMELPSRSLKEAEMPINIWYEKEMSGLFSNIILNHGFVGKER